MGVTLEPAPRYTLRWGAPPLGWTGALHPHNRLPVCYPYHVVATTPTMLAAAPTMLGATSTMLGATPTMLGATPTTLWPPPLPG